MTTEVGTVMTAARGAHMGPSAGHSPNAPVQAAERWLARVGARLKTTPGRMRLASAAILAGLILLSAVGVGAFQARQHAADAVGVQAEPLLVGSQVVYSRLADADATAAGTFLTPGQEPPDRRARYIDDVKTAADQLANVTGKVGPSAEAAQAASVITHDLATYTGLIEAARANNRQGLPVGAAYLREGALLMRYEILPATSRLYQVEANRLSSSYRSGQSPIDTGGVLLATAVALALLLATQLFLFRRTNRLLNLPLVAATFLTVVAGGWTLVSFTTQAGHLRQARINGSDPVQLLSSARILTFRAQGDEGLALVARGSGDAYRADFDAIAVQLGPADGSSGLIAEADQASAFSVRTTVTGPYATYLNEHGQVVQADKSGQFTQAVMLATGPELLAEDRLAGALDQQITLNQQVFSTQAGHARADLRNLGIGVPVLLILAAVLTLLGLQQRINEYR